MTHDQVRQLVRRINPIPDPSTLETVDAPVLTIQPERRTEMQVDERPVIEDRRTRRWRGPLIGIAAAVAVLLGGGVFLLTNEDTPLAAPAPAPNATELPGEFEQPLAPGAYFVDTDGNEETTTRGTFVIEGSGWGSLVAGALKEGVSIDSGDYVSLMVVEVDQVWEAPCAGGASAAAGTTAKALGDQFAAMPEFITREGLAPVSAFGRDGYHLILEVPGGCTSDESFNVWDGGVWGERYYQAEGQIVEYWFLDVEGATVMVEATWPPESSEEIVTELSAALDTLLDTLVITP